MKPRTIVAVAALPMVLGAGPVASETLLGLGSKPCSEYTTARAGARTGNQKAQLAEVSFTNWATGYVQAFHQCMVERGSREGIITGRKVMERVLTALDQHCQSKPADAFAVATTVAGASLAGVKPKNADREAVMRACEAKGWVTRGPDSWVILDGHRPDVVDAIFDWLFEASVMTTSTS
jgi:hypothetical protein